MRRLDFSGGLYSNITALHMARSLRFADKKIHGNGSYSFAVYTSDSCHYSIVKAATLLGMGADAVFKSPSTATAP